MFEFANLHFRIFVLEHNIYFKFPLFFDCDWYLFLSFVNTHYALGGKHSLCFCCCDGVNSEDWCSFWRLSRLVWLPSYCCLDLIDDLNDDSASGIVVWASVRDLIILFLVKRAFCKKVVFWWNISLVLVSFLKYF